MSENIEVHGNDVVYKEEVIENTMEHWRECLEDGWVILGDYNEEFEQTFAEKMNREHGIAVTNDTAALEVSFRIIKQETEGRKVLIPANGFHSIVQVTDRAGFEPVFMDIDIENGIQPTVSQVREKLDKFPDIVAYVDMPCGGYIHPDMGGLSALLDERNVYMVGDYAHAHGSSVKNNGETVDVGLYPDFACYSFYATKVIDSAEGGLILCDNERWDKEARLYRNYGREGSFGNSTIVRDGNNFRLSEFHAALALEQTKVMDDLLEHRRKLADKYFEELEEVDGIKTRPFSRLLDGQKPSFYKFVILLPEDTTHEEKQQFKEDLIEEGAQPSGDVYDLPIYKHPIYKGRFEGKYEPQAEEFSRRHVCIPMHDAMDISDVEFVVDSIKEVVKGW